MSRSPRPLAEHPDDASALLVPLTKGFVAVIDRDDAPLVEQWCWKAIGRTVIAGPYAARSISVPTRTILYMHRLILGLQDRSQHADHIDGNTLNNRRSNLRVATNISNQRNQHRHSDSTSPYKGVRRASKGWDARISVEGIRLYLGWFADAVDAARAYDAAARIHYGDFARLNFPLDWEQAA